MKQFLINKINLRFKNVLCHKLARRGAVLKRRISNKYLGNIVKKWRVAAPRLGIKQDKWGMKIFASYFAYDMHFIAGAAALSGSRGYDHTRGGVRRLADWIKCCQSKIILL